jgi:cytoskeletal protein CcmA (bactofilin family)
MTVSAYDEILNDLENSYKEGEIDESTYQDLKERYTKKLEETKAHREEHQTIMNFKAFGSHIVTADAVKISGSARLPGGVVPKIVKVSGSCKIKDDIEVNGVGCSGWLRSAGSILSHGDIHVSGALKVDGSVSAKGDLVVSGSAKVNGAIDCTGVITVSGFIKASGPVKGKGGVKISGRGKVDGNLYSDNEVKIKGLMKVDGHVIAERVLVKAPHMFQRLFRSLWRSQVDGDVVGSELVDIDNIHVDGKVRGRVVKIGRNSKIEGTVEYVDDLQIAEDAVLEEQPVKISAEALGVQLQAPPKTVIVSKTPEKTVIPRFCPKCGQEVGEGRNFCAACGSHL